jgi:hypothetical protein
MLRVKMGSYGRIVSHLLYDNSSSFVCASELEVAFHQALYLVLNMD